MPFLMASPAGLLLICSSPNRRKSILLFPNCLGLNFSHHRHYHPPGWKMGVLATIARHIDAFVGPTVMLIYPLYASARAIESPSPVDDQQWLTYWVLYSLIALFELSCWKLLQWLPLWPYVKLVLCLWLVLPAFNGAAYIYEKHVRVYLKNYVSWSYPEKQKRVMQLLSLDARRSVEEFIDRYGHEAFKRVLESAEKEARSH